MVEIVVSREGDVAVEVILGGDPTTGDPVQVLTADTTERALHVVPALDDRVTGRWVRLGTHRSDGLALPTSGKLSCSWRRVGIRADGPSSIADPAAKIRASEAVEGTRSSALVRIFSCTLTGPQSSPDRSRAARTPIACCLISSVSFDGLDLERRGLGSMAAAGLSSTVRRRMS